MSGADVGLLVTRALERSADAAGVAVRMVTSKAVRWASATFTGAQHEVVLEGGSLATWLRELPEEELPLRGHLVADLKVVRTLTAGGVTTATLEVLTVEER